ncbi:MAG: hypothetical protein JRI93_11890 [Deltaproteobacteria bacterium]|nr:hypothetical protein [Deltaproteobacteria bacterium]MBW2613282.1 hypothetical protein [Deltaproteobacteria bacterium]MBW2679090.1 hypothetical protein [Deltaproteobacteria bacterium]
MTYKQFVLFLLVLMAISNAGPVYADSSIAANGQPAHARVNFKIVIAPGLVLNMDQLSTDNQMTTSSAINPNNPSAPVENNTFPPLNSPSVGQYVLTDAPETKSMDSRHNGIGYLILCAP